MQWPLLVDLALALLAAMSATASAEEHG